MQAVLDEARDRHLTVDRVSQGSGIFMLSHAEINQMLELGSAANTEVCLFVGPRASWDIGKQPVSSAGSVASPTLRGADQVRYALEDVRQATEIGLRSILVGDVGLLGRGRA